MNGARFGNAVHVGPPAATARPLRNAPPPRLPPASPSRRPPHNTILYWHIILLSYLRLCRRTFWPELARRLQNSIYIYAKSVDVGYSLAQKHGFEEICRPYDRINVAYCNVLFIYKPLTVYNNNVLSIGNFVTKIILGLLKYVISNVQVRSCLSDF